VIRRSIELYAIDMAWAARSRSEDPFLQVGCVLLRKDNTVAATGYKGAPPGIDIDWGNRDARRGKVIHAEANALRYVAPGEVALVATTTMPCMECVRTIASYGIKRVVYDQELPAEYHDIPAVRALADEFGITIERIT
jgi:deoxycytidylate deaminase